MLYAPFSVWSLSLCICFWDPPIFVCVYTLFISIAEYSVFPFTGQWTFIWVFFHVLTIEIKLQWTFLYNSVGRNIFLFLLGKHLGTELEQYGRCLLNFVRTCQTVFQSDSDTSRIWKSLSNLPPGITAHSIVLILPFGRWGVPHAIAPRAGMCLVLPMSHQPGPAPSVRRSFNKHSWKSTLPPAWFWAPRCVASACCLILFASTSVWKTERTNKY